MTRPDYYKALQLDQKADDEVILAAFNALALKHKKDDAMMRLLNEAKRVLLDNSQRSFYDHEITPKNKKVIGDYRLIKKIAEGGFGTTYLAEHVRLGTKVCIKHAASISATDEELLNAEATSIWDLRHVGIPSIHNILTMPDGSLALVMSYIPGPTIAEFVEKHGGMEPIHVAWITERILNILKYLHMHGVVHGDVKPANTIIQPESHTIALVDYGLSVVRPHKATGAKGFTPFFAAPELREGKPPIPESDLFGLGMLMVYALGGDVEYGRLPRSTPDHLELFIKNLVRRDPFARPKVWKDIDLCETIREVRQADFGSPTSAMKPLIF